MLGVLAALVEVLQHVDLHQALVQEVLLVLYLLEAEAPVGLALEALVSPRRRCG